LESTSPADETAEAAPVAEQDRSLEPLSEERPPVRLRLISDYICPWCYIGRVRAERLRSDFPLQLQLSAFDLRPGLPPEGLPREAVYGQRPEMEQRSGYVRQLAAEDGIELGRPAIIADTHRAHQATEFARESGLDLEYSLAVFRAYWQQERNIGDERELLAIAGEVGVDVAGLKKALDEDRYAGAVNEQICWARWNGVTGIPTFVFDDRYALVGAEPYDVLARAVRRLAPV
jgi:predicted DsbA family dithiol-disulfide isomerase